MKRKLPITIGILGLLINISFSQNPGDIIITEYMADPQDVPNDMGEYIEVFNPGDYPVSLTGCVIQDASALSVTIDQSLWLSPGEFAVLGRSLVPGASFYFPSSPPPFNLNNIGGDQIKIICNGTLVAQTAYSANQQSGQAMSLYGTQLHNNGLTLEAHYGPESYQFQYPGTSTTDFGSPTFAGNTFVLPVSLTSFTLHASKESITLNWETATEYNNSHFTIEKSANNRDFFPIAEIDGAGHSDQPISYHYKDEYPLPGESYYRLSQFDYDGTHALSETRSIRYSPEAIRVYPTVVDEEIILHWPESSVLPRDMYIVNQEGRVIVKKTIKEGSLKQTINLANLPRGIYCIAADGLSSTRFVKR